jgi:hypothetical protein
MPNASPPQTRSARQLLLVGLAVLLAGAEVGLFFRQRVDEWHPPSLYALLCGMGALFAGVISIYALRGQRGRWPARILCALATLAGLAATFIFGRQALQWRVVAERREVSNVQVITEACRSYALDHDGQFPASLSLLVATGEIPRTTYSPLATSRDPQKDYLYAGAGIDRRLWDGKNFNGRVITVYTAEPRLGDTWSIGFADGTVRKLTQEQFAKAMDQSNAARTKAGIAMAEFGLPWRATASGSAH